MKTEEKALTKTGPGALQLPSYMSAADRGAEDVIGANEIQLPRLCVAQALSPEIQKGDPKQIPGLSAGEMFSNVLQTNFGEGPLEVVIVRREPPRAVEFWPLDSKEGQGVKDPSVPYFGKRDPRNDPRTEFGPNGEKPTATVFHEYTAFVYATREPIVISFKSTSTAAATQLNTFLSILRDVPSYGRTYKISTALQKNDFGSFYVFGVQPGRLVDAETYEYAKGIRESMRGKTVAADIEIVAPVSDKDVPF